MNNLSLAASLLGSQSTLAKRRAARQNGKLGGRPSPNARLPLYPRFPTPVTFTDLQFRQTLAPLRYPGGKLWLLPTVRAFVKSRRPELFVEAFAGGASVGLTLLNQDLIERLVLADIDPRVHAFWEDALRNPIFADRVKQFKCTRENVMRVLAGPQDGFWTLIANRCKYGGVLDAGLLKIGDGRGINSRWNGNRLHRVLRQIRALSGRVDLIRGDGIAMLRKFNHSGVFAFCDPPYAGRCKTNPLYACGEVDYRRLFACLRQFKGRFLLTYAIDPAIRALARENKFHVRSIAMRTGLAVRKSELLVWSQH